MVTADRYSRYIWAKMLHDQGTKAVTDVLDKIKRIFGIPITCRTDGGPQFRGPFDEYCKRKGIKHETSSPYNPRSNGHAEAAVKAAKHLLLKTRPTEFPSALAAWRNTARENKPSPNELMFCRKIRDDKAIFEPQLHIQLPGKDDQQIPCSVGKDPDVTHEIGEDPDLDITQGIHASDTPTKRQSKSTPHQQIPEEL